MSKDLEKQNQAIQTEEEIQIEPIQSTFNFQKLRFTLAGILAGIILIGMIAAHHCEVGQELRNSKLSKRDNGSPEFSTTTYSGEDGSPTATSTFVYTTRPIINPGRVTIGTLTGYVVESSTTTSTAEPTSSTTLESQIYATPNPQPTFLGILRDIGLPAVEILKRKHNKRSIPEEVFINPKYTPVEVKVVEHDSVGRASGELRKRAVGSLRA